MGFVLIGCKQVKERVLEENIGLHLCAIKVVYEQYLMMYCLFNLSCCMNTFVKSMLGDDFPDFNFLYSIYHARFGALISLLLVYWTRILFLKHIYLHW